MAETYTIKLMLDPKIHQSVVELDPEKVGLDLLAMKHGLPTKCFTVCEHIKTDFNYYVIELNTLGAQKVLVHIMNYTKGIVANLNSLMYLDLTREKVEISTTFNY